MFEDTLTEFYELNTNNWMLDVCYESNSVEYYDKRK